jgi:replicative superfamily II helicase
VEKISPPRAKKTEDLRPKYSKYISNSRFIEATGPNEITDSLDAIVANAKERIWIAVPWFYTKSDRWIHDFTYKLCDVSEQGVDIRLFTRPDISNHETVNRLNLARAKVLSRRSIIRHIHTKMMMNEKEVLTTTANITDFDLYRNLNSGNLTNDEEYLKSATLDFEKLMEPEIEQKRYVSDVPVGNILPERLVRFLEKKYTHLNPMQAEALPLILQHRENLLIGAETGTGKTLLAELAALNELQQNPKAKILYTAPMKAITVEKEEEWSRLQGLGFNVYKITGDEDTVDVDKAKAAHLLLSTGEKWDSMTRKPHRFPFVKDISLMVVDEIHILDDEDRGATIEALLSRTKRFTPNARILGLSATMNNIDVLAHWLNAQKYLNTEYRSVPIQYAFCAYPDTYFDQMEAAKDKICLETVQMLLKEDTETGKTGKVLIFAGSRAKTENTAHMIGNVLEGAHPSYERGIRNRKLRECLSKGTAFLHAGLMLSDRKQVISAFNEGEINVLTATTALAWGVNLAARSVIIRDIFIANKREVDIIGIKQMLGRAGRKGKESVGYGIILVPNTMKDQVQAMLIEGKDIESKLERHILDHINAEIKLGYVENRDQLKEWFLSTFWYYQNREKKTGWEQFLNERLSLLISNDFVVEDKGKLKTTVLGRLTADWYVRVNTVINLLRGTKGFDYLKQGSTDKIELLLMRILAESADELSMFIRSPEEKEEIVVFQTQNPMMVDCSPEATKICMIMLSALEKREDLAGEEYQAYQESTRLMGYLSELGRIKENISLYVISHDLAKRLQFHEERGSGQLLHLLWYSTPDRDFKDSAVRNMYDTLGQQGFSDIPALQRALLADEVNIPSLSSLTENASRFPTLRLDTVHGKHLGEKPKLLIGKPEEPSTLICRMVDSDGEHFKTIRDYSFAYLDLSEMNNKLAQTIGLREVALEIFAMNRLGWDYAQATIEILVLPGSWRKEILDELEDYVKNVETEVRAYSFLKGLWLKIKRKVSYVGYGLDFVETHDTVGHAAQILGRDTLTKDQVISNILYYVRNSISIANGFRLCPPVINLMREKNATYDEAAILTVSLLRSSDIQSGLVEVREGKTKKHYLPTYTFGGQIFVVDFFDEIRAMNAHVRGKTRMKIRNLEYVEDERRDETSFTCGWLRHYFSPENQPKHQVATLRNYDEQDLNELKKLSVKEATITRRSQTPKPIETRVEASRPDRIRKEAKPIPWDGTVVQATYYGHCPRCGKMIKPEDEITWWKPNEGEMRWIHAKCARETRRT